LKALGISPLDKDATVSLVEDGRVLFAAGEERFSRRKHHAGFPSRSLQAALEATGVAPGEIDVVAYPFLAWESEAKLINNAVAEEKRFSTTFSRKKLSKLLEQADRRIPNRDLSIPGLLSANQRMAKGPLKRLFYRLAGATQPLSTWFGMRAMRQWAKDAIAFHKKWHEELETELGKLGLLDRLRRSEHHLSHAANSYFASGLERALIVTIDGYGSGLCGSISVGEHGKLKRLHNFEFPHSLGTLYETVTSSLGFHPDRHAGKVVGLAAYGDPDVLSEVLLSRFEQRPGDYSIVENQNIYFSRHLSTRFPMIDLAAAYQHVLEVVARNVVEYWVSNTGIGDVVLSGGVTANVKMNQRIHELDCVDSVFVYPNMGDGGCGTGMGYYVTWPGGVGEPMQTAYLGPQFSEAEIQSELSKANLEYQRPKDLPGMIAAQLMSGKVVARFAGRMEYGPRALGNRSILYHARDPEVNQWLNQRLGRTEFMPFAPVTLWEERHRCYHGLDGAEHSAEFMTITFDCTDWMKQHCPAAVHVDGTARPQLIRREKNPEYYAIVEEFYKLSEVPCLINTSFNMHEEPIVCSPSDAIRAFLDGRIDGLAIGPFYVAHPEPVRARVS